MPTHIPEAASGLLSTRTHPPIMGGLASGSRWLLGPHTYGFSLPRHSRWCHTRDNRDQGSWGWALRAGIPGVRVRGLVCGARKSTVQTLENKQQWGWSQGGAQNPACFCRLDASCFVSVATSLVNVRGLGDGGGRRWAAGFATWPQPLKPGAQPLTTCTRRGLGGAGRAWRSAGCPA